MADSRQLSFPGSRQAGGEVFTYARVQHRPSSKMAGSRGRRNERRAPHRLCTCVISAAGVGNTFNHLLPADIVLEDHRLQTQARGLSQPSFAHLGVYIGLTEHGRSSSVCPRTNFWIYPSTATTTRRSNAFSERRNRTHHSPSSISPSRPPKTRTISTGIPGTCDDRNRGAGALRVVRQMARRDLGKTRRRLRFAFKAELGERLMQHSLRQRLPRVARQESTTSRSRAPLSTDWFAGYHQGELYGLAHTPERMQQRVAAPAEPRYRVCG